LADKKLVLVGSRHNLTDIIYTAKDLGYEILGMLDKHYYGNKDQIDGVPFIGSEEELLDPNSHWRQYDFFLADWWDGSQDLKGTGIDGGVLRQKRIELLDASGVNVVNLIHPDTYFYHNFDTVELGKGLLILGGTHFTSNIKIGNYSVIDWGCKIGGETYIGNNVILGAFTITGHVTIGDNARIGVDCLLLPKGKNPITIGENSVVFLTSKVFKDVPSNSIYTMHNKIRRRVDKIIKG
jgi:acetyltransferase-like isoleucine patch superfamily enzyme